MSDRPSPRTPAHLRLTLLVVAGAFGVAAMLILSLAGWGFETEPADQVRRDAGVLAFAGVVGATAGAALALALAPRPSLRLLLLGCAVGLVPALLRVLSYYVGWF